MRYKKLSLHFLEPDTYKLFTFLCYNSINQMIVKHVLNLIPIRDTKQKYNFLRISLDFLKKIVKKELTLRMFLFSNYWIETSYIHN